MSEKPSMSAGAGTLPPPQQGAGDILVIGAGGLGCSSLPNLVALGLPIRLVDDDVVSLSNLQRQLLFRTADVGRPKVEVATARLKELHPGADVTPIQGRITPSNALEWMSSAALIVDGTDNFATRFLVNDAAVLAGKPLVHGAILRFTGQVLVVQPGTSACYRCLFEAPPAEGVVPSCAEAGVLGALCGVIGSWMGEAARGLLEKRERSRIPGGEGWLQFDALSGRIRTVGLRRDPRCAVCGDDPTIRTLDPANYLPAACAA